MPKIITFPRMGRKNTEMLKDFFEDLGLKVLLPPITTNKTIKLGVKYLPEMSCLPMKITLGNYIEALDLGANVLLAYDTQGECRFRQYSHIHKFILENLGYKFEMHIINRNNIFSVLKKISGKGKIHIYKKLLKNYSKIKEYNKNNNIWSKEYPNIGIIGEVFCVNDEQANLNIEEKIKKFGGNPINTCNLFEWTKYSSKMLFLNFKNILEKDRLRKIVDETYLHGFTAGHSQENLCNLLKLIDKKVDGIIHLFPLTCMPDSTIEPYINHICKKNNIPLLRIFLDENTAEANLDTRLETFVELIRIKKGGFSKHT